MPATLFLKNFKLLSSSILKWKLLLSGFLDSCPNPRATVLYLNPGVATQVSKYYWRKAKLMSQRISIIFQISRDYDEDFITLAVSVPRNVNIPSHGILLQLQGLHRQWQNTSDQGNGFITTETILNNKDHIKMLNRIPAEPH